MNLRLVGLLALLACAGGQAASAFPLTGTLPREESAVLLCGVSEASMAMDCGPPRAPVLRSERNAEALIEAENSAPDFLAGATPGQHVLVLARRSLASPLDGDNPGRAASATPANQTPVVDPDWVKMPKASDINDYFPERALRMATSGTATAVCTVGSRGDLVGCWMVTEAPSDFAFGVALLELSRFLRMNPVAKNGEALAGRPYALQAAFDVRLNSRSFGITLSTAH